MDVMKEDMKLVSVSEEDAEGEDEMEAADWLWPPLKETAWRRAGEEIQQPIHSPFFFFFSHRKRLKHVKMGPIVRRRCRISE